MCEAPAVAGPYVLATGAVSRTSLSAALSAAFQLSFTGTAVVLTVPVLKASDGLVVKVGGVFSAITVAAALVVVLPEMWVERTATVWVPRPSFAFAEVAVPAVVAMGLPSTSSSFCLISAAGVPVDQFTVMSDLV